MTLRTALLPALATIRGILGPRGLDLRPSSAAVVTRTWSGPFRGEGFASDAALALPDYTKVRHVTQREIDGSGGRYEQGDVIVGPIDPAFTRLDGTTGGFTEAQLDPARFIAPGTTGIEIIYRLALQAGATGIEGDFSLVEFRRDRAFRFMLVIGRQRTTP